jgi:predicted enzyme related to lactoylglutathione lyase
MLKYCFNGVKLGIYNPEADGEHKELKQGNTVITAFGVENLEKEKKRISGFAEIQDEKPVENHRWFTFKDPEGNLLEIHKK